jgi:hypothetical protein
VNHLDDELHDGKILVDLLHPVTSRKIFRNVTGSRRSIEIGQISRDLPRSGRSREMWGDRPRSSRSQEISPIWVDLPRSREIAGDWTDLPRSRRSPQMREISRIWGDLRRCGVEVGMAPEKESFR